MAAWIPILLHSSTPPEAASAIVVLTAPIITTTAESREVVATRDTSSGWTSVLKEERPLECNLATGVKEGIPRDSKSALRVTSLLSNAWGPLLANTNTSTTIEWR